MSRSTSPFVVALAGLACQTQAGCGNGTRGSPVIADAAPTIADAAPTIADAALTLGPALPVAPVGHAGRWLTDAEGRVLLIHGVNMVNKAAPYSPAAAGFSDADAQWLADDGFRLVRVGILGTGMMPSPGVVDPTYVQQIVATVEMLAKHDVYSLVDLHQDGWGPVTGSDGFPAWMTLTGSAVNNQDAGFPLYYQDNPALQQAFQSFWDDDVGPNDAGLQDSYVAMFSAVAKALASEPYVLGYDLFNEPWPGTTWGDCLDKAGGCPSLDEGELAPVYARALAAIRAAGDQHLVLGEPFVLFNFGTAATNIPIPGGDPNAGLAFHVYPLAPTLSSNVLTNALAWGASTGGAVLDTEWGATTNANDLVTESTAFDDALMPWIFWSLDEDLVPSLPQAPGGSNLVTSSASVLVRPYPLVVAGTPQSLAVDTTAQTMSFTWTTARAGGGSFAPGTLTTFEIPAYAYPSGYTATVTGGRVTSAACAPLLTVTAAEGASTVTVAVQAGGTCPAP